MAEPQLGVIAAGHPLTAQAGADVLRGGGNAVDAAVGAGTAFLPESQGVVAPVQAGEHRVDLVHAGRSITAKARVVLIATGLGYDALPPLLVILAFDRMSRRVD